MRQAKGGVLELERFSEESLTKWLGYAQALDRLEDILYFNLEPERRLLRPKLVEALATVPLKTVDVSNWVRMVTYQYSDNPLSCAGSLQWVGGRFNAGAHLDDRTMDPWPALYVAADYETAYREKYQVAKGTLTNGLTPEEMSLAHQGSTATVRINGHLTKVFDMTVVANLAPVAKVFKKIEKPVQLQRFAKKLSMTANCQVMARTAKEVHDLALMHNWRIKPTQFGLPAPSHILAELIRAAGFEAILYPSTKGSADCLAVFPDCLADGSFIELADAAPAGVQFTRLDNDTGHPLSGWDSIAAKLR
ncbi:MAG: RES family NAD+ phosphorylase [Pseudomonadota bacterium]